MTFGLLLKVKSAHVAIQFRRETGAYPSSPWAEGRTLYCGDLLSTTSLIMLS